MSYSEEFRKEIEEEMKVVKKGKIKEFIKENPEVVVIGTAIVAAALGSAIGEKIGYKKGHKIGFAAGVEAAKFVGNLDIQCICPEKDVVKMIIKGMCAIGEKKLELTSNAEQATSLLKDMQACVAAAKTGADPDAIYDILNMSPETMAAIKSLNEL